MGRGMIPVWVTHTLTLPNYCHQDSEGIGAVVVVIIGGG